jgi:MFS family permease
MYVGSALMGLFMSGVYPLTMSMPSSLKLRTSSKNTSVYAMGGCFGTICIPFVVGVVMEHFGPNSLFICMQIIAIAMVGEFIIMNIQRKKLLERKTEEIDSLISSRAPTDEL